VWRTDSPHLLDRYILSKLGETIRSVTGYLDALDSPMAAQELRDFADVLTNWYVRRSRDRFWSGPDSDAVDTLYTVLETLSRLAAPLAPLITEEVWRGLTGGESVHLTDWPDEAAFPRHGDLVSEMDTVRDIASAGLALRKAKQLRVRLPLPELTVVTQSPGSLEPYRDVLAEELNVKQVSLVQREEQTLASYGVARTVVVNARALGPRIGSDVQKVIQAVKAGDYSVTGETIEVAGHTLSGDEYELRLEVADSNQAVAFVGDEGVVLLDTHLSDDLVQEGLARDIVRAIQQARKEAGLDVSDRVELELDGSDRVWSAIDQHRDFIAQETLAQTIARGGSVGVSHSIADGESVVVALEKV